METVPRHVGVILDGNRRFSRRLMMKPWKGHEWGAKKVEKLFDWCIELDIKELTLYAFSMQNLDRPKKEFDYLMKLFEKEFSRMLADEKLDRLGIQINFLGRISLFPETLQDVMHKLMEKTKNYSNHIINFAMAYGGREEVVDAVRKVAAQIKSGSLDVNDINEKVFSENLYTDHEPDLIIRTGGDRRTSNFLIWQSNYSEWCFVEKFWPEFEKEDFIACLEDYTARERRFGK